MLRLLRATIGIQGSYGVQFEGFFVFVFDSFEIMHTQYHP